MTDRLPTAAVADALTRHGLRRRVAPPAIRPITSDMYLSGRALPVRHHGSVDILFEALLGATHGDILVIDNEGRADEACIGDLFVREAMGRGIGGIVVYGCHRDTVELLGLGLPVFSLGPVPTGPSGPRPRRPDSLQAAQLGDFEVTVHDWIYGDADGVAVVDRDDHATVRGMAGVIRRIEDEQVQRHVDGISLFQQFEIDEYLRQRWQRPSYEFRDHLAQLNRAIET